MSRIATRFAALKAEGRGALIPYLAAFDPDHATSTAILKGMPAAGADLIEIGMPFTDPMADGPTVQAAGLRGLKAGVTLAGTLAMVADFRTRDADTPVILMGYLNPIASYGPERFCTDAAAAGVDGLIIVDLPTEEAAMVVPHAAAHGLDVIRLVAPTTDDARLPIVLDGSSGFIYYVSITGITGTRSATADSLAAALPRIRRATALPVAIGFGIRTPQQAAEAVRFADAAVVGTALIDTLAASLDAEGRPAPDSAQRVLAQVRALADGSVARGSRHELAGGIRPAQDPHPAGPARRPGQPLDPVPVLPADAVRQGPGSHLEGLPQLRPPHAPDRAGTPGLHVRPRHDGGTAFTRIELPRAPADPLRFRDSKRYVDRIKEARDKTGLEDACLVAHGAIGGHKAVVAAMAFEFMGGSMGAAVGEAIVAAARLAVLQSAPLIVFTASGGARMQEGAISLMQMPRTTIATRLVKDAGLPFITVLTDPTTGGVTASFAMLGDLQIAEPGALIGFAGARVIEQTVRETLPDGFQRAEYLHAHGIVDMVVPRNEMRDVLGRVIGLLREPRGVPAAA